MDFGRFKNIALRCAGLGEILFDIFPYSMTLGGAPANFAYHCSQMGFLSLIVSAVGHDELGEKARHMLALKYMPAFLQEVEYQTGAVNINIDRNGIPEYTFVNDTAYDHIPVSDEFLALARTSNVACFGTLAQRSEESRKAIFTFLNLMPEDSRIRIFDVYLRQNYYSEEVIRNSLEYCEVFKCNEDELPVLAKFANLNNISPESYYHYLRNNYNINCMIYTEGAKQSSIYLNDELSVLPTPSIDVVDTVGAGDSFGAACICALLKGMQLHEAHEFASKVASFVCSKEGAMPIFPNDFKLI